MPTIQQLVRKGRTVIEEKSNRALDSCPQRRGVCVRLYYHSEKPNSAMRKVARVRLTNTKVNAYIPGEGITCKSTNRIGAWRSCKGSSGVRYHIVRGTLILPE